MAESTDTHDVMTGDLILLATWNAHFTMAALFFVCGAGILLSSGSAAKDLSDESKINAAQASAPGAPIPSFWNWKPKNIPVARYRLALNTLGAFFLALAGLQLGLGIF